MQTTPPDVKYMLTRSIWMFSISTVIVTGSIFFLWLFSDNSGSGMFGPSPVAALFLMMVAIACAINLDGLQRARKYAQYWEAYKDAKQENLGVLWVCLNSVVPILVAVLFIVALVRPH